MDKYDSYKSSSYDWLGEIPSHWEEKFLEQTASEKCVKNIGNTVTQVLSLSYGEIKKKSNLNKGLIAQDLSTYQIIEPGDIIMRLTDLQNDHKSLRTGLVKDDGIITAAYLCLVPRISSEYLHYLLHAYDVQKVFYGMGGGVRQSIGFKDIRHMYVPVPPRAEQDQIVRFLDWKVSEINKLIGIRRKEMQELEELKSRVIYHVVLGKDNIIENKKDTGIGWIGEIPENWDLRRIKFLFRLRDERNYKPLSEVNLLSLYSSLGVIQNKDIEYTTGNRARNADGYKIVKANDIVVNIILCWMGAIGISDYDGVTSPAYDVYMPQKNVCSKYYHYLFRTKPFSDECYKAGKGIMAMRWRVYSPQFSNIIVPFPPLNEQQEIAEILNDKCKGLDALIAIKQEQVRKLRELKNTIISDVVTGKIDVRNVTVPEYEHVDDIADEDSEGDSDEEKTETEMGKEV